MESVPGIVILGLCLVTIQLFGYPIGEVRFIIGLRNLQRQGCGYNDVGQVCGGGIGFGNVFQCLGLTYVSRSPFRVPVARLAAAQAALDDADKKPAKNK